MVGQTVKSFVTGLNILLSLPNLILILDGHKSHYQSIKELECASQTGVVMISLPPHTSHRLQPLDLSFLSLQKTYYHQQVDSWMRNYPGRVAQLFGVAYGKLPVQAMLKVDIENLKYIV